MVISFSVSAQETNSSEKYGNTLNLGIGIDGYAGYYGYIGHEYLYYMPITNLT